MTRRIFSHGVCDAYPGMLDGVRGVGGYVGRAVSISQPGDAIVLSPDLKKHLPHVLRHYDRVGLQVAHAQDFLFGSLKEAVASHPEHELDVFFFDSTFNGLRRDDRYARIVEKMNRKNEFIKLCRELELPVPETFFVENHRQLAWWPKKFPIVAKRSHSATGQHVFLCTNEEELEAAIKKMEGQPFQLQEPLPQDTLWYNVQYYARNNQETFTHGAITRQTLNGFEHDGNIFPSGIDTDLVQPITDRLSRHLFEEGMRGVWAYDVAVRGSRVWLIEANPRYNGATYPSIVAERLGVKEWENWNTTIPATDFSEFPFRNFELQPGSQVGMVLVNWGTIGAGKIGCMLAGTPPQRDELKAHFAREFH